MKASEVTLSKTDGLRSTEQLAKELSELGCRIWDAIHRDDHITDLFFELADAKLALDRVSREDTELDPNAADAIMGMDGDTETRERPRPAVPAREWLKYSLVNFALDWVLDQALMRMKLERKWPFQENDGLLKP
jgi:hypothetical protein